MARILFLPMFLIIVALAIYLVLRIKSMFTLSKSKDVVLSRPSPYGGDISDLVDTMLRSLNGIAPVKYQSEIHVNYKKITAFSRTSPGAGYCSITEGSSELEFTRENGSILVSTGRSDQKQISRENPWVDFWCGISPLEECLNLFKEDGIKIAAGNVGSFIQRNYSEIVALSPVMSARPNQAFDLCAPFLGKAYGKNLSEPGITIRNFMMRLLVNNLTSLPDYIEIKFNVFRNDEFACDFMQYSRLLY
ncbi:MAG: hypothetical protein M1543_00015 [Firmicutes bacterium]|nr:hypothetical protein [Bacillota bacterium]